MTETDILDALREVIDPELGVNIVDLGLVYQVDTDENHARIVMTMTSPACPLGQYLQDLANTTVKSRVPEAQVVDVDIVWNPPWAPMMMSRDAKRQLGWDKKGLGWDDE